MRSDARRPFCWSCQRTHVPCPRCGRPKLITSARCRHCHGTLDPYGFRSRHFAGRCRGRRLELHVSFGPVDGCSVTWGNLDHVHCTCSRPMAPNALRCGRCTADQLRLQHDGYCSRCGLESVDRWCGFCLLEVAESLRFVLTDAPDVSELALPDQAEDHLHAAANRA